jgi:ABC-2 type transport system permease protein
MLVLRDLQKQYTKFRLGYLWTLLEPLGMSIVLWFVFSVLMGARALGQQPYVLFLSLAILPWWWFTKGMSASTRVFRRAGGQLRVSLLPTELWVVRVILVTMVEFVFSLPVVIIAMVATQYWPGPLIALYPVGILLQFLLMYGFALLISAGSVVIPDLARIVRIVVRAMFYLSPIIYSISNIPEAVQPLAALNPLVGVFGLYRIGFWPDEHVAPIAFAVSIGLSLVILAVGIIVFRRLEPRILKEA